MRFKKTVITAGFAMFSMFFGSGNLVFPLIIGTQALDQVCWASLGLMLTGVVVPFLGLLGVILYSGNRENYFACIGKWPAFLLTFFMLAMMGPIGVIPRCILVAHGGVTLFAPSFPVELFSGIFCAVTLFLVWKHDRVVPVLGRVLTPFLLLGVVTVLIAGILFRKEGALLPAEHSSIQILKMGIVEGYQIMDLLAAFFFSATTVAYIRAHLRSDDRPGKLVRLSLGASLIGALLLGICYMGFLYLGARYAPHLRGVGPEQMLAAIAGKTLGPVAIPVVALTIALACLTTSTILTMLFADFLREDISKNRLSNMVCLLATLLVSFFVSFNDFNTLKSWIGSILVVAYPALILLTVCNIAHKLLKWPTRALTRWIFWASVLLSLYLSWA